MSSTNTLFEMETGTRHNPNYELQNKKATLVALNRRRDDLAAEIGFRVKDTIPSYPLWSMRQVNFNDPRLDDIKDDFFKIEERIYNVSREINRLEAIENNDLPRYEARVKVYDFLGKMGSDENRIRFLQSHHLTTTSLIEAVYLCPGLLEDLSNFEENLEIIRSEPDVWW